MIRDEYAIPSLHNGNTIYTTFLSYGSVQIPIYTFSYFSSTEVLTMTGIIA